MKKQGRFEAKAPTPAPKAKKKKNSGSRLLLSLVSSIVSMILCCTMFLGTTLAWFTDTVVSAGNQITIGELEVGLYFGDQSLEGNPLARTPAPKVFDSSFRWAPDRFEARSLTIENSGSLDIQYVLNLLPEAEDISVAKYFDVYVYTGTGNPDTGTLKTEESRKDWKKVGNLAEMLIGGINVLEGELKAPELTSTQTKTTKTIAFALHMHPDVKTEEDLKKIAGQSITFGIKLNAYQIDTPEEAMKTITATTEAPSEPVESQNPEDISDDSSNIPEGQSNETSEDDAEKTDEEPADDSAENPVNPSSETPFGDSGEPGETPPETTEAPTPTESSEPETPTESSEPSTPSGDDQNEE